MLASTLTGLQYFLNALFLVAGIVFLVKGADYFVDSASVIAKRMKIPPIIILLKKFQNSNFLSEANIKMGS